MAACCARMSMVVVFLVIIHVNDGPRGGGGMGMRRSNAPFILALLCAAPPCVVEAQFGSLQVDWSTGGSASVSDSIRPKPDAYVVPGEARVFNLWELVKNDPEQLKSIVESFQIGGCDACQSDGHWVAKVRQGVLEMRTKRIQAQLLKRGIRCVTCTQHEHWVDKLLDTVHLPYLGKQE